MPAEARGALLGGALLLGLASVLLRLHGCMLARRHARPWRDDAHHIWASLCRDLRSSFAWPLCSRQCPPRHASLKTTLLSLMRAREPEPDGYLQNVINSCLFWKVLIAKFGHFPRIWKMVPK